MSKPINRDDYEVVISPIQKREDGEYYGTITLVKKPTADKRHDDAGGDQA